MSRPHGVLSEVLAALGGNLPSVILSFFGAAVLAPFALLEKLQRQAATAISPIGDHLQGWLPRAEEGALHQRAVVAARIAALLGLTCLLGTGLLGSWMVAFFGAGRVLADQLAVWLTGAFFGVSTFNYIVSMSILVPLGAVRALPRNAAVSAILTLVLLIPLTMLAGTAGAFGALLIAALAQTALIARSYSALKEVRVA